MMKVMEVMKVIDVMDVMKAGMHGLRATSAISRVLTSITSITFITFITAASAFAAEADKPFASPEVAERVATPGAGSLIQVTLSLVLVLGAVFAAAWLVRRLKTFGKFGSGPIEIIADVSIGAKERAVLVQIGGRQLLLGVAPGRVNTLHVLEEPVKVSREPRFEESGSVTADASQRPDFKAILKRSLGL
jgi:flagellar protein FliO/FliZ